MYSTVGATQLSTIVDEGGLVVHQVLHCPFDILALRQDEIFELRSVADESIGSTDTADRSVQIFE